MSINFCSSFSNSGDDDLIRAAFAFLRSCLESKRGEQVFFFRCKEVVSGSEDVLRSQRDGAGVVMSL